jgi:hypothetical protein
LGTQHSFVDGNGAEIPKIRIGFMEDACPHCPLVACKVMLSVSAANFLYQFLLLPNYFFTYRR